MSTTTYLLNQLPGTASERIALNDNVSVLDGLLSIVDVADINITNFPASPAEGRVILLGAATGAATGLDGHIAIFTASSWISIPAINTTGPIAATDGFYVPNASLDGWTLYAAGSANGTSSTGGGMRQTAVLTTPSIGAGSTLQTSISLARSFFVLAVTHDSDARSRLYKTAAQQSADVGRDAAVIPSGQHGVITEFTGSGRFQAQFQGLGASDESPPVASTPITITNNGATATAITVTVEYLELEP